MVNMSNSPPVSYDHVCDEEVDSMEQAAAAAAQGIAVGGGVVQNANDNDQEQPLTMLKASVVGREFVRQYYTVLSKVPDYLNRFYSHDSIFVHPNNDSVDSGVERLEEVTGQLKIAERIKDMNFLACQARIHTVSSHATVGDAVVVQVCGELRKELHCDFRRFCQTFVLMKQTPKKYYVHNDIFQYLDIVFDHLNNANDDNDSHDLVSSYQHHQVVVNDDDVTVDVVATTTILPNQAVHMAHGDHLLEHDQIGDDDKAKENHHDTCMGVGDTTSEVMPQSPQPPRVIEQQQQRGDLHPPQQQQSDDSKVESVIAASTNSTNTALDDEQQQQQQHDNNPSSVEPKGPKSWARITSGHNSVQFQGSGVASSGASLPQTVSTGSLNSLSNQSSAPSITAKRNVNVTSSTAGITVPVTVPPIVTTGNGIAPPLSSPGVSTPRSTSYGIGTGAQRNGRNFSMSDCALSRGYSNPYSIIDSLQVFVGNLPKDVEESELSNVFERFGKIMHIRIQRKSANDPAQNLIGFVAFEDTTSVEEVMKAVDGNENYYDDLGFRQGYRINIERKRPQQQQGGGMMGGYHRSGGIGGGMRGSPGPINVNMGGGNAMRGGGGRMMGGVMSRGGGMMRGGGGNQWHRGGGGRGINLPGGGGGSGGSTTGGGPLPPMPHDRTQR